MAQLEEYVGHELPLQVFLSSASLQVSVRKGIVGDRTRAR